MQELVSCMPTTSDSLMGLLAVPSLSSHLTQGVDEATIVAEATFWKSVASLNEDRKELVDQGRRQDGFWPLLAELEEGEGYDIQW